jgi:flagellar basal body-associated protein FliL
VIFKAAATTNAAAWGSITFLGIGGVAMGAMIGIFSMGRPIHVGQPARPVPARTTTVTPTGPIVLLEPFTTNLGGEAYLQAEILVHLDAPEREPELRAALPSIRDHIMIVLAGKDLETFRGSAAKEHLRLDVLDAVNAALPHGGAKQVYFNRLLIE